MEQHHHEPQPPATLPTIRHDGWTGERMADFCETLAETAVVAEACDQAGMGISGAYAARRRNPVFAAAWDAALTIARERLADTLLARSMEGNVEQIYKDGELVGERHVLDNRLGLQMLRRLDRLAERKFPGGGPGAAEQRFPAALDRGLRRGTQPFDWNLAVDALRIGDDQAVAKALALVEGDEVEEVEGAPNPPLRAEEPKYLDLSDRCWWEDFDQCWLTNFPPPAGFAGYESRPYDDVSDDAPYVRACTEQEAAILEADAAADRAAERAEEEQLRDAWFEYLAQQVSADTVSGAEEDVSRGVALADPALHDDRPEIDERDGDQIEAERRGETADGGAGPGRPPTVLGADDAQLHGEGGDQSDGDEDRPHRHVEPEQGAPDIFVAGARIDVEQGLANRDDQQEHGEQQAVAEVAV